MIFAGFLSHFAIVFREKEKRNLKAYSTMKLIDTVGVEIGA